MEQSTAGGSRLHCFHPEGYAPTQGRRLSGGSTATGIARACDRSKLLLLDEPTEGIQPTSLIKWRTLLAIKQEGKISILLVENSWIFASASATLSIYGSRRIVAHGP